MKGNELMIGDWIYNTFNQQIEQVVEIRKDQVILAYNDGNDYDEIEPIPLTVGILEKNGWVSRRDGSGNFDYLREGTPGYGSSDMIVTMGIIGRFQLTHGSFCGILVDYVHKLQHALRLCGIDKEIEL